MTDPVLHLIVGPNGAGKSSLFDLVIEPVTHLEFVNADVIAAATYPDDPAGGSYEAARLAADRRSELLTARRSFATETVFSHPSKLEFLRAAVDAGYLTTLHVVVVPEALAVARVANRVANGGHRVPATKVRARYRRLWPLVAEAIGTAASTSVYDNSRASEPFRLVARFECGRLVGDADWPGWTPDALVDG
jgi:predicted ABC-type ATPase